MFCCQHYSPFYHIIPYRRKVFTYNCQMKKDIFEPKQNKAGIQSRDIAGNTSSHMKCLQIKHKRKKPPFGSFFLCTIFLLGKLVDKLEEELLDSECIISCKTVGIACNVAVYTSLRCKMYLIVAVDTVLIGVSKCLHDKDSICKLNCTVTISVAGSYHLILL